MKGGGLRGERGRHPPRSQLHEAEEEALREGGEWLDGVEQGGQRHLGADCERCLLQPFAGLGPQHGTDTVETIAREVGYSSEYAFNRAFSRQRGPPPGRYRRIARAA